MDECLNRDTLVAVAFDGKSVRGLTFSHIPTVNEDVTPNSMVVLHLPKHFQVIALPETISSCFNLGLSRKNTLLEPGIRFFKGDNIESVDTRTVKFV